jgi:ABC-2 type transport system ATP-binding protein
MFFPLTDDYNPVNNLDLSISAGEFVAILGPNGAGKTTLVEMIEGIQVPDDGNIIISGKEWRNHEKELHNIIGLSLQETRFMDKLTTFETTKLFASLYGLDNKRVNEVIELVGLDEKKKNYVNNLSGGQRQRLALAIALLNKPRILLLDEPTSGLDPNARREIWNILLQLKRENTTLILTTHYMEEAEILCDRIVIMDQGKILAQGSLADILKQSDKKEVVEFTLREKINSGDLTNPSLPITWDNQLKIGSIVIDNVQFQLLTLFNFLETKNLTIEKFDYRRVTLDDIFTSLTGRHLYE